jgi:hypothetical protein
LRRLALAAALAALCAPASVAAAETVPAPALVEAMPWQPAYSLQEEYEGPVGPAAGRAFNVTVEHGGYCAGEREPRIHHVKVVERRRTGSRPFNSAVLTVYVEWPDRPPLLLATRAGRHDPPEGLFCAGIGWAASRWVALKRPARDLILFDGSVTPPHREWPKGPRVRSPAIPNPGAGARR